MRHPATATVKGEKKMDDVMEGSLESNPSWEFEEVLLLLAALDWRGVVEFQRPK
jgi:hypothetical protein